MKKILVIEDSKTIAMVLGQFIGLNGYKVVYAFDAMQAIMFAQRELPDLIVLDIMMPAGGGFAVVEKLNLATYTQAIPIIVYTAADIEEVRQKTVGYGIKYYVQKPDQELVLQYIEDIIGSTA
ncbi:MAG: response regulator [Elusimicrobiota bacterium]